MPTFLPYPSNHPAGPQGWPMNILSEPCEGSITLTDPEYAAYISDRQPAYDAWLAAQSVTKPTSDELLAANGRYAQQLNAGELLLPG